MAYDIACDGDLLEDCILQSSDGHGSGLNSVMSLICIYLVTKLNHKTWKNYDDQLALLKFLFAISGASCVPSFSSNTCTKTPEYDLQMLWQVSEFSDNINIEHTVHTVSGKLYSYYQQENQPPPYNRGTYSVP